MHDHEQKSQRTSQEKIFQLTLGDEFTETVILHYLEARYRASQTYRDRVLTYGPDTARLILRSFDELGVVVDYIRSQQLSTETETSD